MTKKNKILIIGAKGMLGQVLAKVFSGDKNNEVTAWDKEEIDITDEKQVGKKISKLKPEIIINAAAYNAVDKCEDAKGYEIAKNINGQAPGYLAKIAKKINAILVHYSSDYVFDGEPELPEPTGCGHNCGSCGLHEGFTPQIGFAEYAKPKPINNYGKSKLMGEKEVQKNTKKYYIIRTSKLFGKPAISEGAKKSFFDVMLEAGKKNNGVHPVKYSQGESAKSGFNRVKVIDEETACFTYAPDLAKKTKEIIESKKPFGIYHVVNSEPCTWYEAVLELYQQAKIKTKVIPISAEEFLRPAKRPYYSVLLNTKLNPMRSYKEALREYLKSR
ncbi:MAG: NAD(P)-dependent oxidoreductase [Candidatus Moranbacteria bacterium]|nr:NAD(P)-dependent oxidoreductase [Candidatus Moranbacteria bacterium]